jgi:hypothetical protein
MIESNQIRRNNCVYRRFYNPNPKNPAYEFECCKINAIGETNANISDLNRNLKVKMPYSSLFPIPLTEQSILKLDFSKDNSENNKTYLSPMFDGNVIKIYFNRFGVAKFQINMHFQIELPYIHTLQNLYHTLSSGRELVYNE